MAAGDLPALRSGVAGREFQVETVLAAVLAGEAGGAAYHAGHDAARAADGAGTSYGRCGSGRGGRSGCAVTV